VKEEKYGLWKKTDAARLQTKGEKLNNTRKRGVYIP